MNEHQVNPESPVLPQTPPELVPAQPPIPRFSADWRDLTAALALYVLSYLYLWHTGAAKAHHEVLLLIFVLGFVALAELLHWQRPRPRESWIWLGCMAAITVGMILRREAVWSYEIEFLFLHLAAVWWLLCRSGVLLEGETGHLIFFDGVFGFLLYPFKHFILRIRTLIYAIGCLFRRNKHVKSAALLWSLLALGIALPLFVLALWLLTEADAGFSRVMGRVADWFRWDLDIDLFEIILSLPVGAYLFGLLAGTRREKLELLRQRGQRLSAWVLRLRKVPNLAWSLLTAAFCLLYLLFFVIQGRYLFGAFTRTLPEGFIVSHYARRGFFELCWVMAVNFALLWLITRASRTPVRENRLSLAVCLILLVESLLFAVVAFSKLALYIDCFGFTPLRLQSSWLVCVLFVGCLCAGYTLLTGKKTLRPWVVFSAVTLSALCLV